MEEGLALIFRHKPVTRKSLLRIEGILGEFEHTLTRFSLAPAKSELIPRLEGLMRQLCEKFGQLENLVMNRGENSDARKLAVRALTAIKDYCGNAEFSGRASLILAKIEPPKPKSVSYSSGSHCYFCRTQRRSNPLDFF